MAELTLGQLLDVAIGAPKTEPIDFEQLRNLLNGMLINLGLRDLPVQESGEPLEGTPAIPSISSVFADIEQLKQRTEDNEREIAEVKAVCEELREEIKVLKEEQSHMVEKMQDMTNFQDMLESLRNELLSTVMDMMGQNGQVSLDPQGSTHAPVWKDHGLIVIGNEITLAERSRTSSPRHRDTAGSSPVPSRSKVGTHGRGKDVPPGVTSSPQVSFMARGMGLHNVGRTKDEETKMGISKGAALPSPNVWSRGKNLLHGAVSSPQVPFTGSGMGWNDVGQIKDREIKRSISKGAAHPSSKAWSREKNLPHGVTRSPRVSLIEGDVGWNDMQQIKDEEIKTGISKAGALPSPLDVPPEMVMEQIKDEKIKMSVSKAESLPSPLGVPPEMDMEQIKDEKIMMSISKAESLPRPVGVPPEMDMQQIKDEEIKTSISKPESLPRPVGVPPEMDMQQSKDEEIKMRVSMAESLPRPVGVPYEMDMEQIKDEEIKTSISKAESLPRPLGAPSEMDMEQIKDEEIKMGVSKAESLPTPQGVPYEMDVEQIKDEKIKMSISKAESLPSPQGVPYEMDMQQIKGEEIKMRVSKAESLPRPVGAPSEMDMQQIKDEEIKMRVSMGESLPRPMGVPPEMGMEQSKDEEIKTSISKAGALPRPQGVPYEMDMEQSKDEEIKTSISKAGALPRPLGAPYEMDMQQIKDEEIKMRVSMAKSLPRPVGAPYEMDMQQIKDEETEMSLSKAPPHIQTKTLDGSVTALGVHPGSPRSHMPTQPALSVRGHAVSQGLWVPAESVSGTSRSPTAKEARGGGSVRMEPSQMEPGMKILKVPSHEYLPSDQPFTTRLPVPCSPPRSPVLSGLSPPSPGSPALFRRSDIISYTPPPSPGLTGRLPHLAKQDKEQGQRGQAAEGYSRRSPMYCGGRHTSVCPVQPMEPLLPNPSTPGAFDLVGRDGLVYRGRHSRAPMGSSVEGARYSKLQ